MSAQNQDNPFYRQRRAALLTSAEQIGIDFIEVEQKGDGVWQLTVNFLTADENHGLKHDGLRRIKASNLRIRDAAGVVRQDLTIGSLKILPASPAPADDSFDTEATTGSSPAVLTFAVKATDPSAFKHGSTYSQTYTLEFVNVANVDRFFAKAPFSFSKGPSVIDPQAIRSSDYEPQPAVEINYLAKDYASFRRLILDHLALQVPNWQERHVPDLGIMLVEVMAYAADYLSYYQDAVATEAYLGTARRLISIRRHARLLDYQVSEGCNARTWVHFKVSAPLVPLPQGTKLLTSSRGFNVSIPSDSLDIALAADPAVFETMYPVDLYLEHNQMNLYTWGATEQYLDKGETTATLVGHFQNLKAGDVLIFEETLRGDAGPKRCHPVRLAEPPNATTDPLYQDNPVTEIRWHADDALPFPLFVNLNSSDQSGAGTIVIGNNVLADHGITISDEELPRVAETRLYNPKFQFTDVTFAVPFNEQKALTDSASAAITQNRAKARPAVKLRELENESRSDHGLVDFKDDVYWYSQPDLLNSGPFARDFVVETEQEGTVYVRFGDGSYGVRPTPGTRFKSTYRVGKYQAGNIGQGTLKHLVSDDERFTSVRNPLAAEGGTDSETLNQIRLNAPAAFRGQLQRCVTETDYVTVVKAYQDQDVQNARARIYWTGSWHTIFIYVQRQKGQLITDDYRAGLLDYLDNFRLIGNDIEISGPHYAPLNIALTVYVDSHHSKNAVLGELNEVFSNVVLLGGDSGFFYPSNFTFGQTVYLSPIIAAAMNVSGVIRVEANRFQRLDQQHRGDSQLAAGQININTLEIARLDNDPRIPENGIITFKMKGER